MEKEAEPACSACSVRASGESVKMWNRQQFECESVQLVLKLFYAGKNNFWFNYDSFCRFQQRRF